MGAPVTVQAAEQEAADALLSSFTTIGAQEGCRHATVYHYWLTIRGDRDLPTIRDLDPLQISDAGPCSVLLQLKSGGEDAEIRHIGEAIKTDAEIETLANAPRRSLLSCIATKIAIVAISRDALAFEDEFETAAGTARCRVTLLPFSSAGPWVDYVYGFVTTESGSGTVEATVETVSDHVEETPEMPLEPIVDREETPEMPVEGVEETRQMRVEPVVDRLEETPESSLDLVEEALGPSVSDAGQTVETVADAFEPAPEPPATEPSPVSPESPAAASKGFDPFAGAEGFFGNVVNAVDVELEVPATTVAAKDRQESDRGPDSPLHGRLAEARAKADEARLAKLQSDSALYQGVSAAYDFALDADDHPEEYLKLVETHGLRIQLRSPMTPVVRMAFDGLSDEATIAGLEGVLAWALRMNLPRGSLAARIEAEGGIAPILNGQARER